jgi:hypothetical protein
MVSWQHDPETFGSYQIVSSKVSYPIVVSRFLRIIVAVRLTNEQYVGTLTPESNLNGSYACPGNRNFRLN